MSETGKINVGIGFATGRKSFQKILKTYVYNWKESGLTGKENISLNLFVAFDLKYSNTKSTDYTNVKKSILDLVESSHFIGTQTIDHEIDHLVDEKIISRKEARLFFDRGYAGKRNAVLYYAIKNKMDHLVFFDDDEYPVAVTDSLSTVIWGGQHVLSAHLKHIKNADITNGHHCGYISPIPCIEFNEIMTENDFRKFIEAISNDIINWDKIRSVMENGGVTFADKKILVSNEAQEVQEVDHTKFISGSNLCINLTDPNRVIPFYNPPNARGEDTFLSTCLSERKVLRVPCYTFHDGFSGYRNLMNGVLPIRLKRIDIDSKKVVDRFYRACIGWVRYKPLLLYITQREDYEEKIEMMRHQLAASLPKICTYFNRQDFMNVSDELEKYHRNVRKHYMQYLDMQRIWGKIIRSF